LHIIGIVIIGFIVGLIARAIHPGDDRMGFILTTLLGIVGAVFASYAGQTLGLYAPGQPAGFVGAVIGAVILLILVNVVRRTTR
jgi:uncharacterized membrane protein YeaQ/YmgE (transglycosylase-associated protein family)